MVVKEAKLAEDAFLFSARVVCHFHVPVVVVCSVGAEWSRADTRLVQLGGKKLSANGPATQRRRVSVRRLV